MRSETTAREPVVLVVGRRGPLDGLVRERLSRGHTVINLHTRLPDDLTLLSQAGAPDLACDLTVASSVEAAFIGVRARCGGALDSVIHLAEADDLTDPDAVSRVSGVGTRNLLRALDKMDHVGQIVVASTAEVLERPPPGGLLTPQAELDVVGHWPHAQRLIEQLIERHRPAPSVLLRTGLLYGRRDVRRMMRRLLAIIRPREAAELLLTNEAGCALPVLHYIDAATCIARCVERRAALSAQEVFLVAEPEPAPCRELLEAYVAHRSGLGLPDLRLGPLLQKLLQPSAPIRTVPRTSRIADQNMTRKLEWAPQRRMADHLSELLHALDDARSGEEAPPGAVPA